MSISANCKFKVVNWDEKAYKEFDSGAKLTKATVTYAYQGDLTGDGSVEFLMSHAPDGTASFVGIELITGKLSGKYGSFIIQHIGTFDKAGAHSKWSVIPNSGTNDLVGISGEGSYTAMAEIVDMPFTYAILSN